MNPLIYMGQEQIIEKLNKELENNITKECQVVYILSRIRKILEIEDKKTEYKYLNFYCNWALHSKIDRTEPVRDVLDEFIVGSDDGKFLKFDHFFLDLKDFLDAYHLSVYLLDKENYLRFINLLVGIIADTPVEVRTDKSHIITITEPTKKLKGSVFSIGYTIE
jgi:hypothetical protein